VKKTKRFSTELIGFLKKTGIDIVYFFGSRVEGTETEKSDFDIGIVFETEKSPKKLIEIHPHLYNLLSNEFPVNFQKDIDIVYLQDCSFAFQYYVIRNGIVIYEFSFSARSDYEEYVLKRYLDFQPISEIFSSALMERN
jgi:predicted nucleotidyltransferase